MRFAAILLLASACAGAARPPATLPAPRTLTIIGTNDLHGHVMAEGDFGGVALLGGYLKIVRAERAADGGGVLLLDGGDEFQGTMESNLNEGHAVVEAFNLLGYDAMAIGNHEFDFGPVGPAIV